MQIMQDIMPNVENRQPLVINAMVWVSSYKQLLHLPVSFALDSAK